MSRVAVTTSADNADRVARLVEAAGMRAVRLPCIGVHPAPEETLERLRRAAVAADWIVVTSPRAVEITWPEGGMPVHPRVAAVGAATAAAVARAGGRVVVAGRGGAAGLHDLLRARVRDRAVVFPHARSADPETAAALRAAGATVTAAPAYATVPVAPGSDEVDAVILGSPSAVEGWLRSRDLTGLAIAVMGETTAAAVRARGFEPAIVPEVPDIERVVTMLAHRLRQKSERSSA